MKESKLIEMQKRIEILGAALKNTLIKLNALQEFTQGILTSLQIYVGKDGWEEIVKELKNIEKTAGEKSKEKENVEQPVEKRN